MTPLRFWIVTCGGVTRTQRKRSSGRAGFVSFTRESPVETGSSFSRRDRSIIWKGILPKGYPPEERADCQKPSEPVTIRSLVFVDGHGVRARSSDFFRVTEQFHEAH